MGKIVAETKGQWCEQYLYPNTWGWNANTSDILTKLIHYAGRYVDQWASDLFISWQSYMENNETRRNKDWNQTIYFGFRMQGVDTSDQPWCDGNSVYLQHKMNSSYYRRIAKLEIKANVEYKDWITMTLTEIA